MVDYDPKFRLYLTTKLPNPHYSPETCLQLSLLNFTLSDSGVEDILLEDIVSVERPDLEQERNQLMNSMNKDKEMSNDIQEEILRLLFTSNGNILDNLELINTLNESQEAASTISQRLSIAEQTELTISTARDEYRNVARRGCCLYFVVASLADIDHMYQFSLKYVRTLLVEVVERSEKNKDIETRIGILLEGVTMVMYSNVSRGLYECHKLVYSFMLCIAIQRQDNTLSESHWDFLLRGVEGTSKSLPPKPDVVKLTNSMWNVVNYMAITWHDKFSELPNVCTNLIQLTIGDLKLDIQLNEDNVSPPMEDEDSEPNLDQTLIDFEKLMLIKCLKEEMLIFGVTEYVKVQLGKTFVESPSLDLHEISKDMSNTMPVLFVLSPGSDPVANFQRFSADIGYRDRVHAISLGQGQGVLADKLVAKAIETGDWVFLQNCHLAGSWMGALERIVLHLTEGPDDVHKDFRLFMSSLPAPNFPVSVLQNSLKVAYEPPKGIRSNVKHSLSTLDEQLFNTHSLDRKWRQMVFGVCFFHAVIQERKKFGFLGWNMLYEFNDSDQECALRTLKMYCAHDTIPWDALTYTLGEVIYGGRVTDPWDQRTIKTILLTFFGVHTLEPGYKYSDSGTYYCPEDEDDCKTLEKYKEFVDNLPIIEELELFGMDDNVNFEYQTKESKQLMQIILDVQRRESSKSEEKTPDELVYKQCDIIIERIKTKIDKEPAHPVLLERDEKGRLPPLTTVLMQETDRLNRVLLNIHTSLDNMKKAIKGIISMNDQLEGVHASLLNNQVPTVWSDKCSPSLKSLGSWIRDLELRIDFISVWINHGPPVSYWISGFFFPQGFLTGCLLTHARLHNIGIETLKIDFVMTDVVLNQEELEAEHRNNGGVEDPAFYSGLISSPDHTLVHGLFLDAARYDTAANCIADPQPGIIYPPLPAMQLTAVTQVDTTSGRYPCPLYKTSARAGIISTSGHSTNFVTTVPLPSEQPESYWVLKGAALLTQIAD
uniref:Dynein heavy chain 6, axonemal n=1 Tax=Cacopsylla melanoneura TaxID=428564 RepID=A0A8D9F093_9HEMI